VESDLSRYHQIDYRDRWRFDANGSRRLTLRMIHVRLKSLPLDSAVAIVEGSGGWTLEHYLTAQLWEVQTGEPHPAKPKHEKAIDPQVAQARKAALIRKREREAAIAEGRIT
jgi:hypothetical protein